MGKIARERNRRVLIGAGVDSTDVMFAELSDLARKNPKRDQSARLVSARIAETWNRFPKEDIERVFGVSLSEKRNAATPSPAKSARAAKIKALRARLRPK